MVANLRPVKRIDRFLALAKLVAKRQLDVQFVLIGDGSLRHQLQEQLCGSLLEDRLHVIGSAPNAQDYLLFLNVGLLTSESEGLSNALIEYVAADVPAVAFDVGGNSEVLSHSHTSWLVQDGDVAAMTDRVIQLLTDHSLREGMSAACCNLTAARFSPAVILRTWEDFLNAGGRNPRRSLHFN